MKDEDEKDLGIDREKVYKFDTDLIGRLVRENKLLWHVLNRVLGGSGTPKDKAYIKEGFKRLGYDD
jgi:hypothetical protein